MRRTALCLAWLALTASGCYSFVPMDPSASPRVGERVRLELTPDGTTELARFLGPRVVEVEGQLVSVGADRALVVAVNFVEMADRIRQPWSGEGTVTFPPGYIASTQERHFEKRKSVLASSALAGALILTAVAALRGGGAGGGENPPPPPPP